MLKRNMPSWLPLLAALALPAAMQGQDLVEDALASFPPETIRLEYSSPATLRKLTNYASLRQRYVGARLQKLETSLSQVGVQEGDLDELVLGWRSQASAGETDLYGLAAGRFNAKVLADRAAASGASPENVAGMPAYCFEAGVAATCVVVLSDTRGAFGTLTSLNALLQARSGQAPSLGSEDSFSRLLREGRTQAPIWGVARGAAVADWFKGWMPGQKNLQLDWSQTFQAVEGLAYSVEPTEKVRLDIKMDCTTPEAAASLRQLLEGLKLAQQLAWQTQNVGQPNPFEALEVETAGRRLALKLTTGYGELEGVASFGSP